MASIATVKLEARWRPCPTGSRYDPETAVLATAAPASKVRITERHVLRQRESLGPPDHGTSWIAVEKALGWGVGRRLDDDQEPCQRIRAARNVHRP